MPPGKRIPKATYSPTEVGALIGFLRNEIRIVAEGVADIRTKVDQQTKGLADIRQEVEGLKTWRLGITDELRTIRAELKTFDQRLGAVEAKVGL